MTFGEKRKALRLFRKTADEMRALVNSQPMKSLEHFSITLDRERFEACEFGMSALKTWIPELDDEAEIIPGKGRLVRANFLYRLSKEPREHFVFKSIPVFLATS